MNGNGSGEKGNGPNMGNDEKVEANSLIPAKRSVGTIHEETGRGYNGGTVNVIGNIEQIKTKD